ncbi:hypothetical protein [Microcoleus sp. AT3-D2]|uniref:hypothetical protein n=1 Tax=Microcoleus sp. AT3-D2 TaxID=2818612 RepID=UPI002FD33022
MLLLLKFSASLTAAKSADSLRYKNIPFQVENLTPGLHVLKLKPVTGCLRTLPVQLPQLNINRRQARLDANFALDRVSLAFPATVPTDERKASRDLDARKLAR